MEELSGETEENKKPNSEIYFLPEILHNIFQNLNVQDLSRVASVNKLWNEVATHVLVKRGPETSLISFGNTNVYESIRVKPYVALMFTTPDSIPDTETLQQKVFEKYKNRVPYHLAAIGTHRLMMDEKLISVNRYLSESDFLSLVIPEYRDLQIRAAYTKCLKDRLRRSDDFLDEFLPEDSESKATFIILGESIFPIAYFFDALQKSMEKRQQKYSMWGAAFDDALFAIARGPKDENKLKKSGSGNNFLDFFVYCDNGYQGMFAMSITGLSLESSSIVISCEIKKHEFDQKLLDFRNELQLKRYSIGLACGPDEVFDSSGVHLPNVYASCQEIMHAVKVIFPDIRFIGIFNDGIYSTFYGLKSKADVVKKYMNLFENDTVHLRTDVLKLNDKNVVKEDTVNLVIPEYRDLKVRSTFFSIYNDDTGFIEDLLPKDCNLKLTLLVFISKNLSFDLVEMVKQSDEFPNNMKERNQKYAVWGICLPNDIAMKSVYFNNGDFCIELGAYAMSITGNCLHSFSTVIDCRIKERKFNRKLRKFREQPRLKRDSIGLVCGPKWIQSTASDDVLKGAYRSCEEVMCFVKTVFPDIPIISLFNGHNTPKFYGVNSMIEDFDQELEHIMTFSFMILTYD